MGAEDTSHTHKTGCSSWEGSESETCYKAFTRRDSLKAYMIIHSSVKSFEYETCHKAFTHASSLKRHDNIHMKVKPCE